jgi:hypothetical protein
MRRVRLSVIGLLVLASFLTLHVDPTEVVHGTTPSELFGDGSDGAVTFHTNEQLSPMGDGVVLEWLVTDAVNSRPSATDSSGNTYVAGGLTVQKYTPGGQLAWTTEFSPCGGPCEMGYAVAMAVSPSGSHVWVSGRAGFSLNPDAFIAQVDGDGTFQ